jgi:hypothetical protein
VEIYFENGDSGKPVYLGKCPEMGTTKPMSYMDQNSHVIFESPLLKESITFNDLTGVFVFGKDAAEAMVLGTTLKGELQKIVDQLTQLALDFSTWVPVPNDGGAALKTQVTAGFLTKPSAILLSILSLLEKVK